MGERSFQTEFIRGARGLKCCHVIPIPDSGMPGAERVYDLGLLDPAGGYHAVELKQVSRGWGWPIDDLKPHQEEYLEEAIRNRASGWVVVHYKMALSKRNQKAFGVAEMDRAWAAPLELVQAARDDLRLSTLTPDWLEDPTRQQDPLFAPVELPQVKVAVKGKQKTGWDPRPMWRGAS